MGWVGKITDLGLVWHWLWIQVWQLLLFSYFLAVVTGKRKVITSSPAEQEQELATADNRCTRLKSPSDLSNCFCFCPCHCCCWWMNCLPSSRPALQESFGRMLCATMRQGGSVHLNHTASNCLVSSDTIAIFQYTWKCENASKGVGARTPNRRKVPTRF